MGRCEHCAEYICECQVDLIKLTAHNLKWAVVKKIVQETGVTVYAALAQYNRRLHEEISEVHDLGY
jgi:phosphoribosyl-ATP pyrophosphohydrolase